MKQYDKIVRDNIPRIMISQGKVINTRRLNKGEVILELRKKLNEELHEYQQSYSPEELVDIIEVCIALANRDGISEKQLMENVYKKRFERGGFDDGVYLISEN